MMLPRVLPHLLILLHTATAFTPVSQSRRTSRSQRFVVPEPKEHAKESILPVTPQFSDFATNAPLNTDVGNSEVSLNIDVPLQPSIALGSVELNVENDTSDLGAAIFLANSDKNAEVVAVIGGEKPLDIIDPPTFEGVEALLGSNTGDATVDAVLAASSEATAAAEALLQSAESLELNDSSGTPIQILLETSTINPGDDKTKEATTIPQKQQPVLRPPTLGKLLKFAIPAIGVWLCNPLLSLIDTAAVGIFSGTAQQAALNPAVAVTDYAALLIAFLYTGTTNLMAASNAKDDNAATAETFVGAIQLSVWVGAGLAAILLATARPAVLALLGGSGSPTVISAALSYIRIRALGMPAAALIGSSQAASLGMQDVKSPLYVLAAAAIVNFLGDMLLVRPMGAAGAAWATVASQYVAAGLFWKWLSARKVVPLTQAILDVTTGTTSPKPKRRNSSSPSVRGFLHGKLRKREIFRRQRLLATWKQFREYVIPVTSTQLGRVSGYVAMSHVVSSTLGTASMAAQQIIVSLFYCLTPVADSLSLTAQSFVPAIAEHDPSASRTAALRTTMRNLLKAGAVFGGLMTAAISCIPLISGLFSQDPIVVGLVNGVTPLLAVFFSIHGMVCAAEGLLLGQKDLNFLGKMYAAFFVVLPLCMLRLKTMATTRLSTVWQVFVGYQVFRSVAWTIRALQLQARHHEEEKALSP